MTNPNHCGKCNKKNCMPLVFVNKRGNKVYRCEHCASVDFPEEYHKMILENYQDRVAE